MPSIEPGEQQHRKDEGKDQPKAILSVPAGSGFMVGGVGWG